MTGTPILLAPLADPGAGRSDLAVPPGSTVAAAVAAAMPGLAEIDRRMLRVLLVSDIAARPVPPALWDHVRPKPGVRVVIRAVPGGGNGRSLLLAVVSIASLALAPGLASALVPGLGKLGTGLVAAGLQLAGSYLVNTLIPVPTPDQPDRPKNRYSITGWRNEARPDQPIPSVHGRLRYAPPFAATSFSEIVGDELYVRALFTFGYGRVRIEDMRLGDTPIGEFDEVEWEAREGVPGDDPVTLYPLQVLEESVGVELIRPPQYDDAGEKTGGPNVEVPVVRATARDTQSVSLVLSFPGGLFRTGETGNTKHERVRLRIRQRQSSADPWTGDQELVLTHAKRSPFFRQHSWNLPSRGKWDLEVTRMSDDDDEPSESSRVILSALQSIRPEYPIAFGKPLALVALRIKATYQLNGQLDNFNALVTRYAPKWDGATWTEGLPRNPAAAFRTALEGPANAFPVTAAQMDLGLVEDWWDFCAGKGLEYNAVHDTDRTLGETLGAIASAGRASWRDDGVRWGVTIDRPNQAIVDHISAVNAYDFSWSRSWRDLPDAFRVEFLDETDDYKPVQRIVPRPGYEGPLDIVEDLSVAGKTDPAEVYIEAVRRWHEILERPDTYSAMQDGMARIATRGDDVALSMPVLDRTHLAARVLSVSDALVVLDEALDPELGTPYGIRFRTYANADDSVGTSRVVPLLAPASGARSVVLADATYVPEAGAVVHVGPLGSEDRRVKIAGIEAGENGAHRVIMFDAAPQIDTLTDAVVPPPWDGRVGGPIALTGLAPGVPLFRKIESDARFGILAAGQDPAPVATDVIVRLAPSPSNSLLLSSFRLEHRLAGAVDWTEVTIAVAEGGTTLEGYLTGEAVEMQAVAINAAGEESVYTPLVTHTVGGGAAIPAPLDGQAMSASGGLGHAELRLAIPNTAAAATVTFYRVPAGQAPDFTADAVGPAVPVTPGTTLIYTDGDATREALISNGGFDTSGGWTAGTGWTISGGVAQHSGSLSSGPLSQDVSLTPGAEYALAYTISGRSSGEVAGRLAGGAAQAGAATGENGRVFQVITAASGNDRLEFVGSATFDGAIDDVVLYRRTSACTPQGAADYYAVQQDAANVPGAPVGPVSTIIQ